MGWRRAPLVAPAGPIGYTPRESRSSLQLQRAAASRVNEVDVNSSDAISRRRLLTGIPALALTTRAVAAAQRPASAVTRARLKQSVCRWCYAKIPLRDFCQRVAEVGLTAIDLLTPEEWPVAREFGLACSMGSGLGGTIENGINDPANHEAIAASLTKGIPLAAAAGVEKVITFFGNRRGRSDAEAVANCVRVLNRVKPVAEDHGVTVCIELLNSKVDHKDYQGDRTPFGVEVVAAVNSPRVKLLYDIYHMQIMEGDVIRTLRAHQQWIAHYHTGGVPGRNEIDAAQELNYPAIARAIADTGFSGFFAHEFVPRRDPISSLREAVALCDV
jgi:hydroxypyruvate isomerase